MIRRFKTLKEIQSLPGYLPHIRMGEHEIAKPLGYYKFKDHIHCALESCNQLHGFGYVIKTTSGGVIGVGNVCGPKLFGDAAFETAAQVVDRAAEREFMQDALEQQLRMLPSFRARAEKLLHGPGGAVWYEAAEMSLRGVCPKRVLGELYDRASNRDPIIEHTRERTKGDPEPLPTEKDTRYITEPIGRLRGLGALTSPSAREVLESRILKPLLPYLATTAGAMVDNKPMRKQFSEWHRSLVGNITTAESRLRDAQRFFKTSNLRMIAHLARNPADRALLSQLAWDESLGRVVIPHARKHSVTARQSGFR